VLIALASSLKGQPLAAQLVSFGEIGLTGEVRPVAYGDERLREAQAQGFRLAIVPQGNAPRSAPAGMRVIGVTRIAEALEAALARNG
jgi:DNA repair protein RadA/Sms